MVVIVGMPYLAVQINQTVEQMAQEHDRRQAEMGSLQVGCIDVGFDSTLSMTLSDIEC